MIVVHITRTHRIQVSASTSVLHQQLRLEGNTAYVGVQLGIHAASRINSVLMSADLKLWAPRLSRKTGLVLVAAFASLKASQVIT
jgi:hypothetical protein